MSPFDEDLAEKYGLTGDKLQEFHQALNELFEAYENDDEDYQFLYGEFINVIKNFGIDDDKIGYLVKDLYDYNEHRDLITAFSMSATINGDYSDKNSMTSMNALCDLNMTTAMTVMTGQKPLGI